MISSFVPFLAILCGLLQADGGDSALRAREIFHSLQGKPSAQALEQAENELLNLGEAILPVLRESLNAANSSSISLTAKLLQRWGGPPEAAAIFDFLQANPPAESAMPCMHALFAADPQAAPARALRLLDHKLSAIRAAAAAELAGKLQPEHAAEVLRLSRAKREDTRARAIALLGFFSTEECLARLLESLADPNPEAASAAVNALARSVHPGAIAKIEALVAESYLDRAWAYACLALAQRLAGSPAAVSLASQSGRVAALLAALGSKDAFVSGAAAVLLAQIGYLAEEGENVEFLDREVPQALVAAISRPVFHKDFNALLPHLTRQLQLLSGESGLRSGGDWARWWVLHREHFRARRWATRLTFSGSNNFALEWIRPGQTPGRIFFAARDLALPARLEEEYRLDPAQSEQLLTLLRESGARLLDALPVSAGKVHQYLFLRGEKRQTLVLPVADPQRNAEENLRRLLQEFREKNLWQLFPDSAAFESREQFLRAEEKWWQEETKPELRALRLKGTILRSLPRAGASARVLGLSLLRSHPPLRAVLSKDDLPVFLALAGEAAGAQDDRSREAETRELALDLALQLGDEKSARALVDALVAGNEPSSQSLLRKIYLSLGPSASRRALEDTRPAVRAAAAEAFASFRTPGSSQPLLRLLEDPEFAVRRSAVHALGRLAAPETFDAVAAMAQSQDEHAEAASLRAESALALARIGTPGAIPALSRLLGDPEISVRHAAVQGLTELGGEQAAAMLAEIAFREGEADLAELARQAVLSSASEEVLASLRRRLNAENAEAKRRAVLMLAQLRDRAAIDPLLALLTAQIKDAELLEAASVLASKDLFADPDPVASLQAWSQQPAEPGPSLEAIPGLLEALRSESWPVRMAALRGLRVASAVPYPRLTRSSPLEEWERAAQFFRKFLQDRAQGSGQ